MKAEAHTLPGAQLASSAEARALLDRSRSILLELGVVLRHASYYSLTNGVFEGPIERLCSLLAAVAREEGTLRLERRGKDLFANGVRLRMELRTLQSYKRVCDDLAERGLGGIAFLAPCGSAELMRFLESFVMVGGLEEGGADVLNRLLAEAGVDGVRGLADRCDGDGLDGQGEWDRRERALIAYQQTLDFIRKSLTELDSPAQVNQRRAKRLVQRLVDLSDEEGGGFSLAGLAAIRDHDHYTFNHMVNVCVLAVAFGRRLGLERRDLSELGLCALYHDMGKLHIPLEILNKREPLDEREWAEMGNHTVYAARTLFPLLRHNPGMIKPILSALQHHAGYDGEGYPGLRVLVKQTLYSRIIAIVDAFDAMVTKRVYQREMLPDEALRVIHGNAGRYSDPVLVKGFINALGTFPVGSTVELSTGEVAVVVESNADPEMVSRPTVRVVTDAAKELCTPRLLDLSRGNARDRRILRCVHPEHHGINSAHFAI